MDRHTTNKGRRSSGSNWRRGLGRVLRTLQRPETLKLLMSLMRLATALLRFFD